VRIYQLPRTARDLHAVGCQPSQCLIGDVTDVMWRSTCSQ